MKTRVLYIWEMLRTSYWFVPGLMVIGAAALSFGLVELDDAISKTVRPGWAFGGAPAGAREVLSTIAGSVITVAGVTFSITIAALTLASSQFGPRLLRNFLRDTGNQIVLGTFISTFIYCLLVLRTVRGEDNESSFVPHISVSVGVALAVASIGVLIYFIHHVSVSIQADQIIAAASTELDKAVDRLFPKKFGKSPPLPDLQPDEQQYLERFDRLGKEIIANRSGFVQAIDADSLMEIATGHDIVIHLLRRPGDFVVDGDELARIRPREPVDEELAHRIEEVFILGVERTPTQDVLFAVEQLVEIAVRALSPSTNDPFTAISCLDRLGVALSHMVQRELPSAYRYDDEGWLRIIAEPVTYGQVVDAAFDEIRRYARGSVSVTIQMLETIGRIARYAESDSQRAALLRQAQMIARASEESQPEAEDYARVVSAYQEVVRLLKPEPVDAV